MNLLENTIARIKDIPLDPSGTIQKHIDDLTKPPGSLGILESLALRFISIKGTLKPETKNKVAFVMAGDHGIAKEGVSAFPQAVTGQMVQNFLEGGAAINVIARHAGAKIVVVDCGIIPDIPPAPGLKIKKVARGTDSFLRGPAMSKEQAISAIEAGISAFEEEFASAPIDIACVGDMGIGNTTPSSAIIACITGNSAEDVTGRGTGIDDKVLEHKIDTINKGLSLNNPDKSNALDVLTKVGGFEIGGIAGICLAGASHRVPVVFDGLIATAGALLATTLTPAANSCLFASHKSVEPGQKFALEHMGQKGIIDFGMRLGEGTGAAIAMNIIELSVKLSNEMATFSSAGVSGKTS